MHSRKIPRPRLEILDEAKKSRGKLPPYISCMYFGFKLTFHFSMDGGNGRIFRRPESRLQIFLSFHTTKFQWVAAQECTSLLGQPFMECEDFSEKPKAVIPSRKN